MDLILKPEKIVRVMALMAICLILNHIGLRFMELYLGHDCASGLFRLYCRMFTVNAEGMVPTMYSTVALLFCSTLLTTIALSKKKTDANYFPHWLGLAFIFLFLAMDEALEIHEQFVEPVRSALDITSGPFFFAWVIPYGIALFIFLVAYLQFTIELPARTRLLFVSAGCIYVTGAIGFELLGGHHSALYGKENLMYIVLSTSEEVFEMGGIVVFVYALLSYISSEFKDLRIGVASE